MPKMKRKDAFLGIHFDFHAMPGEVVPTIYRPEVYEKMLDAVHPDYTQCDTKGHAGLSSYPTKYGTQADEIKIDILRMMRNATEKRNIALFGHHSGVFDQRVAKDHPDWAAVNDVGEVSKNSISCFSPYVDKILIPQLKELAGDYGLDGAWVDGECWGCTIDYSTWAVEAYKKKYNGKEPARPADDEYLEFCRQGFRDYVAHYIEEVKKDFPNFEITSNWIYSAYMPEKATINVDFLSGDYDAFHSFNSARTAGRLFEARKYPWDLMSWGHSVDRVTWLTHNRTTKGRDQYLQEAAAIVAIGGGYEFFNILYGHGGTVQEWAIPIWEQTAKFCRERQICHKGKLMAQIGIIFPNERAKNALFSTAFKTGAPSANAYISALQDSGFSTSVILESEFENLERFPVIIVPNSTEYAKETLDALEVYVKEGGKLIIDAGASGLFEGISGIKEANRFTNRLIFLAGEGRLAAAELDFKEFEKNGAQDVLYCHDGNIFEATRTPAVYKNNVGKGIVCTLAFSLREFYNKNKGAPFYGFIRDLLKQSEFTPYASISGFGSSYVDLSILEKDGYILVNLCNRAGLSDVEEVRCFDEVPFVGPITIKINDESIKSATLYPEKISLEMTKTEGGFTLKLEKLHIMSIIKLEK